MLKGSCIRCIVLALLLACAGLAGVLLLGGCGGEPQVSIQELIDQAEPDATVVIPAGSYRTNLYIRKSITLVGDLADPSQAKILGIEEDRPAIHVVGDGACTVALQGFSITSSKGNGILVERNAHVIAENVHVQDCDISGFSARGAATLTMIDCSSSGNLRNGVSVIGEPNAILLGCKLRGSAAAGLAARTAGEVSMTSTVVEENGEHGIKLNGETALVMEDVTVERNGGGEPTTGEFVTLGTALSGDIDTGIYLEDDASVEMTGCTIAASARDGIVVLDSAALEARSCAIQGNARNGIVTATDGDVTVLDSTVVGNGRGIWIGGSCRFTLEGSRIIENADGGVVSFSAACYGSDVLGSPYRHTGEVFGRDNEITPRGSSGHHTRHDCCPARICDELRRELDPIEEDSTESDS